MRQSHLRLYLLGTLISGLLIFSSCTSSTLSSTGTAHIPMRNCDGTTSIIDRIGERIVTADPAILHLVLELGQGKRVLGTGWADGIAGQKNVIPPDIYAQELKVRPLAEHTIDKETLLTSGADMYIDAFGTMTMMVAPIITEKDYRTANIAHVIMHSSACVSPTPVLDFSDVYGDIRLLGAVMNAQSQATTMIATMNNKLRQISQKFPVHHNPSIFYFASKDSYAHPITIGNKQIGNAIYTLAGAHNAFTDRDATFLLVSWEEVIAKDPDYIHIAVRSKTPEDAHKDYAAAVNFLRTDSRTKVLTAVKKSHFIFGDAVATTLPGLANITTVETIAKALTTS